jgi:hypothetical protein
MIGMPRLVAAFSLFLLFVSASVVAQVAPVAIGIDVPASLAYDGTAVVRYSVENTSDQDMPRIDLDMYLGNGAQVAAITCGLANGQARVGCSMPLVAHGKVDVAVTAHYPGPGHYNVTMFVGVTSIGATKTASRVATFYRDVVVTTTADDGAGSLRAAIADANENCPSGTPCRIRFNISAKEPWHTIAPASPLPPILPVEMAIDGEGKIFLDGRGAGIGDGLTFGSGVITVRGMAIGNFPGSGILIVQASSAVIENNFLGADPSGAPAPNGMRGLMGDVYDAQVSGNVMSYNGRSGVFLLRGANIHDNRIQSNGASGIYLGGRFGSFSSIVANNVITGNHDFGVAFPEQASVEVQANTFAHNGGGAIDVGLDGRTQQVRMAAGTLTAPRITGAHFDAATGDTIIEGTLTEQPGSAVNAYVYANESIDPDGYAEGERFLGAVKAGAGGVFSLRVHADLRGEYIDAGVSALRWDLVDLRGSSELGPPLRVD